MIIENIVHISSDYIKLLESFILAQKEVDEAKKIGEKISSLKVHNKNASKSAQKMYQKLASSSSSSQRTSSSKLTPQTTKDQRNMHNSYIYYYFMLQRLKLKC